MRCGHLVAVLVACASAGMPAFAGEPARNAAPDMPDVRSLAELRSLPVVVRAGDWAVRLAMADAGEHAGPWKLLACHLTWLGPASRQPDVRRSPRLPAGGHDIGPLTFSIIRDGLRAPADLINRCGQCAPSAAVRDVERLYAATVPTLAAGAFRVVVWSPELEPLRQWEFRVARPRPCAWRTFAERDPRGSGPNGETLWRTAEDTRAAVPKCRDDAPLWRRREGETFASLRGAGVEDFLPGQLPPAGGCGREFAFDFDERSPHWPLRLELKDGRFLITAGFPLGSELDERLLARWWVNGRLVRPPAAEAIEVYKEAVQQLAEMEEIGPCRREVASALPRHLGRCREGDSVAVQLMYCAGGYWDTPDLLGRRRLMAKLLDCSIRPGECVLSNPITFRVTGEMLRAAVLACPRQG